MHYIRIMVFGICLLAGLLSANMPAHAQAPEGNIPPLFSDQFRVADAATLVGPKIGKVQLWGIEAIPELSPVLRLSARVALEDAIKGQPVQCERRAPGRGILQAQCASYSDVDLGLIMLQKGYVMADRGAVFGTIFEDVYVQAEAQARLAGLGIWGRQPGSGGARGLGLEGWAGTLTTALLVVFIVLFSLFAMLILRSLRRLILAQDRHAEIFSKEHQLREKERKIVAMMIDSELKANKAKIEAYLVVYEEVLRDVQDQSREPKYKKSGDIIQKQPVLDRAVFDRNTDKLDILGRAISSALVHFYARLKTAPDYVNLEPSMAQDEAITLVRKVVENARQLDQLGEDLIIAMEERGVLED